MYNTKQTTTITLIAFNTFLFIVTSILGFLISSNVSALEFLGGSIYQFIENGQVWRLITSSFLHANIVHLLFNMYALYILGRIIETEYSGKTLFVIYIFTALFGSLMSFMISIVSVYLGIKDPNIYVVEVGASAALFGMMGFLLVTDITLIDKRNLINILFLNIFIGVLFSGIVDNWAHVGGVLAGLILAGIDNRSLILRKYNTLQLSFIISIVITISSFLALILFNYYQLAS